MRNNEDIEYFNNTDKRQLQKIRSIEKINSKAIEAKIKLMTEKWKEKKLQRALARRVQ